MVLLKVIREKWVWEEKTLKHFIRLKEQTWEEKQGFKKTHFLSYKVLWTTSSGTCTAGNGAGYTGKLEETTGEISDYFLEIDTFFWSRANI